jgi:very-short-patch-repair endonuclease
MTKAIFLEKARKKHGYKYNYINLSNIIMQMDYIELEYKNQLYSQRVVKHLKGNCPEKKTTIKENNSFIEESKKIWGDKYNYSLTKYIDARTKIKIIHDGIIYEQLPGSHLKYPVEGYLDQDIFLKKAHKKWGNKYDYSLVNFKTANTKIKIILNGIIYEQTAHNHLKYAPEKLNKKKNTNQFIIESNQIHDFIFDYTKTIYKTDREKVIIECQIHGEFEQLPNSHLRGRGCPYCKESKGEKQIAKILNKYNINFDRQKKFSDCKNIYELPFDFFIPSLRLCVEFDGVQHYEPITYFGGIEAFEKLKINDKIKNDYCEDNYINLIRIKYNEIDDIEKIITPFIKKSL